MLIPTPLHWMMWSVEKSDDPFGIEHYWKKYHAMPNQAQVPANFSKEQLYALAEGMHIAPQQIIRNRECQPGCIFLAHKALE